MNILSFTLTSIRATITPDRLRRVRADQIESLYDGLSVYGETTGDGPITESHPTVPVNPYGQSKLGAERHLRAIAGTRSVTLRYFNVAGASPEIGLGEAHFPETHLIPRLAVQLAGVSGEVRDALGLVQGFKIYGDDYATRDGTAVRDYLHVRDLADAHVRSLDYLLNGGGTEIFNLGSGAGYSVREIVRAARDTLERPDFNPEIAPRRAGDPGTLVASSEKAQKLLGWTPTRDISEMIRTAAAWHRGDTHKSAVLAKARMCLTASGVPLERVTKEYGPVERLFEPGHDPGVEDCVYFSAT